MNARRGPPRRREKTTVLIVGEGRRTEPNYFYGLTQEQVVRDGFAVKVKKGHGYSAEAAVHTAIKHMKTAKARHEDFDEVWCVVDVEGQEKRESLLRAIDLAGKNAINLCLSNPAFEVWLLAHFARRAGFFLNSDAVEGELNREWQRVFKRDYRKNNHRIYHDLSGRTADAISNAQWVRENHHCGKTIIEANSSTEVYKLVKRLLGQ